MKKIAYIVFVALILTACHGKDKLLPTVTGSSYEVLVVMNDSQWNGAAGDTVRKYLEADMPCLPQIEPTLSVSRTPWREFSDILKPVRNIVLCDIDSARYTQAQVKYMRNIWSQPQAVVRVQAHDVDEFMKAYSTAGKRITQYFVNEELNRQHDFYRRHYTNPAANKRLKNKFGIDIRIPNDLAASTDTTDFFWITDTKGRVRRDIVVYTVPYTSTEQLTLQGIIQRRDSVLRLYIHGREDSSYIATEWRHIPPQMIVTQKDSTYCAEVRGLWRMEKGDAMGGPFVMHARIMPSGDKILVAEGFCFGPGQKKRNPLRQLEAVVNGMKFIREQK
ncbi:MAG TPA: hypothetical protein DEO38_01265 [Bacteroidales bacterium]|nr:hypothetical protein [Bacteroidales bacterium]